MSLLEQIKNKARTDKKTIVLAEGHDPRTVKAAAIVRDEKIADIVILGNEEQIRSFGEDLTGVKIIDPAKSEWLEDFADTYYEMRKAKGMTPEKAMELMKTDVLVFGAMMVKKGKVDGMVAGAVNSTSNVIRAAVTVIKMAPGIKYASSCFIMESPYPEFGDNGKMVYGDCGFVIDPDADQLSDIAIATAKTAHDVVDIDPKVAMLSFSTKGSAKHERIDKVVHALNIVKESHPELDIDGEMQLDAAIVPVVAKQKAPGSTVAGHANVLVFPNLESGNIGYKIAQRFGGYMAIGPVMQGLAKPVNDLSRGCVAEDIVAAAAITALQSK